MKYLKVPRAALWKHKNTSARTRKPTLTSRVRFLLRGAFGVLVNFLSSTENTRWNSVFSLREARGYFCPQTGLHISLPFGFERVRKHIGTHGRAEAGGDRIGQGISAGLGSVSRRGRRKAARKQGLWSVHGEGLLRCELQGRTSPRNHAGRRSAAMRS